MDRAAFGARQPPVARNVHYDIHIHHTHDVQGVQDHRGTAHHTHSRARQIWWGSPLGWVGLISITRRKNSLRCGLFQTTFCKIIVILCFAVIMDAGKHSAFHDICDACHTNPQATGEAFSLTFGWRFKKPHGDSHHAFQGISFSRCKIFTPSARARHRPKSFCRKIHPRHLRIKRRGRCRSSSRLGHRCRVLEEAQAARLGTFRMTTRCPLST